MEEGKLEQALFEIRRVIAGQEQMLERVLVCLLAGGHVLIEGVPGLGEDAHDQDDRCRTWRHVPPRSVHARPRSLRSCRHACLPSGPRRVRHRAWPGLLQLPARRRDQPRARRRVQSALLEVMQERQVTIGHQGFPVPSPFLVLATQNPIEYEGTYPLPEAQVDRFMLKVLVDYPAHDEEGHRCRPVARGRRRSWNRCCRSTS